MDITPKRLLKLMIAQIHTRNTWAHKLISALPQIEMDRPIFILGLPRSGTSIFCTLMGSSRYLAHWSEAPVVWDPRWRTFDNEHRWTAEQATTATLRRINNNFGYFTKWKGCKRFINKHPRNALRVPFLSAGWNDCFLINIKRDPRAVANSLLSITRRERHRQNLPLGGFARPEGWREINAIKNDMEKFCRMVVKIHETLQSDLNNIADRSKLFEVSYEDFAADCRGILRNAYQFVDIEVDEKALSSVPEKLENRNYKWARTRTRDEITTMYEILGNIVLETGYEKDNDWIKKILDTQTIRIDDGVN